LERAGLAGHEPGDIGAEYTGDPRMVMAQVECAISRNEVNVFVILFIPKTAS
jgi:hypothetical protein